MVSRTSSSLVVDPLEAKAASSVAARAASRAGVLADAAETGDLLASATRCLALIGALADGRRHAIAALAKRVLGPGVAHRGRLVQAAVERLHALGMPLDVGDDGVRAARFVPLDAAVLARALPGWHARVVGLIESTNTDLLRTLRADPSFAFPALLASELQFSGRGRLGRGWASAPGVSLTASFAFRSSRRLAMLEGVTLVCGLAVRDAVVARGVDARLKWPNDVLCNDRKLAGILVEAHALGSAAALVVGVGLNTGLDVGTGDDAQGTRRVFEAAAGSGASLAATDLAACGADALDRNRLAIDIARALERRLRRFDAEGFGAFVDEWNEVDAFRDRPVRLTSREPADRDRHDGLCGVARGVDVHGALVVDAGADTPIRVISADVSLRPLASPA